jgi:hypothetical protein
MLRGGQCCADFYDGARCGQWDAGCSTRNRDPDHTGRRRTRRTAAPPEPRSGASALRLRPADRLQLPVREASVERLKHASLSRAIAPRTRNSKQACRRTGHHVLSRVLQLQARARRRHDMRATSHVDVTRCEGGGVAAAKYRTHRHLRFGRLRRDRLIAIARFSFEVVRNAQQQIISPVSHLFLISVSQFTPEFITYIYIYTYRETEKHMIHTPSCEDR